jgi:hypothetical protein
MASDEAEFRAQSPPDYKMELPALYLAFARFVVQKEKTATLLYGAGCSEPPATDLPSLVPDWRRMSVAAGLGTVVNKLTNKPPLPRSRRYRSSMVRPPRHKLSNYQRLPTRCYHSPRNGAAH